MGLNVIECLNVRAKLQLIDHLSTVFVHTLSWSTFQSFLLSFTFNLSSCSTAASMDTAYVCSAEEVLEHFNVTKKDGLNDGAVEASRAKYGSNGT